jgi:predicted AlkP superfamily phosphohydrolase/phosphomutase
MMLANRQSRNLTILVCAAAAAVLVFPCRAEAYIGPGAGFAVAGSFLAMFAAILSAFLALFTWPVRYIIRAVKHRKAFARSRVKRFVILGLDGMDPLLTEKFLAEGKLPNFAGLRDRGCFKRLATTLPSMSPVAWSSFQTGSNPGKHNIFDFLTRDTKTYLPKLSSVDIRPARRTIGLGRFQIPVGPADIRLNRKGKPFWKTLGEHGIFSSVIRVPITFPPEKFYGVQLSGMCVPDLRGTQGMFSFYTTRSESAGEHTGGQRFIVEKTNGVVKSGLIGSANPFRKDGAVLKCPFEVRVKGAESAELRINGERHPLKKGQYSNWVKVGFKAAGAIKVRGVCRFLLLSAEPEFELYVTPINIDPERPAMPISHPAVYSTYLAKRQGPFATLGLAEDSWALNEKVIDDEHFIQQCVQNDEEREKMFFDALDKVRQGLCVCVFDGTDRIQHTFWRQIDPEHPAYREQKENKRNAIEELYVRMDGLVGRVLDKCDDKNTVFMIISDHGFSAFRYGVDLNRWLEENGYLKVVEEKRNEKNLAGIDWSGTRGYAVGLAGIYLNIKGREAHGIVEPGAEAQRVREEISGKLGGLVDAERKQNAIKEVYNSMRVFDGPYKENAPDLIVGYNRGYRAWWQTAVGQVTRQVIHDNTKAWSGDHCIDPSFVPGVLFCNRDVADENPRLMDIGPTVLDMFGVDVPKYMDGRALVVADADGGKGVK